MELTPENVWEALNGQINAKNARDVKQCENSLLSFESLPG